MTTVTPQPRAAIYLRVSSAGQEDGYSLDTQEARCREYVAEHGYQVAAVFREVWTGADLFERPALASLRDAVRQDAADVVLAYSLDRLTRDQTHISVLAYELQQAGVKPAFVTEDFEDSPVGRFLRNVSGFVAELERVKITERVTRGRRARAESGKLIVGNRALYGYRWRGASKAALDPDPLTAPIVQRIFREVAAGVPMRQVAETLTREGIPTPTGQPAWSRTTIHGILDHPYYRGEASAYRYRYVKIKEGSPRVRTQTGDRVELPAGTVSALVDEALWLATQQVRTRNQREASRRNQHPEDFLLRGGYVVCAGCAQPMHTDSGTKKGREWRRYVCLRKYGPVPTCETTLSIDAPTLDNAVWADIAKRLHTPELIRAEVASLRSSDPATADLASIDGAIAQVERKRANVTRAIAAMDDPELAAPLVGELANLGAQRKRLQEERAAVEARQEQWEQAQARLDDLEHWLRNVGENLANADYAHKRLALEALDARVEVYPKAWARPKPWTLRVKLPLVSESIC